MLLNKPPAQHTTLPLRWVARSAFLRKTTTELQKKNANMWTRANCGENISTKTQSLRVKSFERKGVDGDAAEKTKKSDSCLRRDCKELQHVLRSLKFGIKAGNIDFWWEKEKAERRKAKGTNSFIHISWSGSIRGSKPATLICLSNLGSGRRGRGSFVRIQRAHLVLQCVCVCVCVCVYVLGGGKHVCIWAYE